MEQKEILEAGALAIKSINVIEQAYRLVDNEIEVQLWLAVEKAVAKAVSSDQWRSDLSKNETNSIDNPWIAKTDWQDEDGVPLAKFYIWGVLPEENNDQWLLTQICGLGEAEVGIEWAVVYSHKILGLNKLKWRAFAAEQNNNTPKLKELNFKYKEKEGRWFLPMHVERDELADAWENEEMDDFLDKTVNRCMQNIFEAVPEFDRILEEAKNFNQ
ncbi:hypothetical protein JYT48_02170 [Mariprofundus ferrooxydans]|nr:hypothetical protein [Mariprofundus ferrooxydans]MBN4077057.1 hypothetical protein [Mariprofundus ferrooxydans]